MYRREEAERVQREAGIEARKGKADATIQMAVRSMEATKVTRT